MNIWFKISLLAWISPASLTNSAQSDWDQKTQSYVTARGNSAIVECIKKETLSFGFFDTNDEDILSINLQGINNK